MESPILLPPAAQSSRSSKCSEFLNKVVTVWFLDWGCPWQCPGLTSGSVLRDQSWWGFRNHIWYQTLNPGCKVSTLSTPAPEYTRLIELHKDSVGSLEKASEEWLTGSQRAAQRTESSPRSSRHMKPLGEHKRRKEQVTGKKSQCWPNCYCWYYSSNGEIWRGLTNSYWVMPGDPQVFVPPPTTTPPLREQATEISEGDTEHQRSDGAWVLLRGSGCGWIALAVSVPKRKRVRGSLFFPVKPEHCAHY